MERPRLRGWSHAASVPFAVTAALLLHRRVQPLPALEQLPALLYGLALVVLFSTSAAYHVPGRWSPAARTRLVRLDGAATVLLIVGTFVPVAAYRLEGAWRLGSLVGAMVVAVVGIGLATSRHALPARGAAAAYVVAGWLAALPVARLIWVLPWEALLLIALGGVLYTLGAIVFARRRPDPSPAWFGYHEVFHVLVIAAAALHFIALWHHVLPSPA